MVSSLDAAHGVKQREQASVLSREARIRALRQASTRRSRDSRGRRFAQSRDAAATRNQSLAPLEIGGGLRAEEPSTAADVRSGHPDTRPWAARGAESQIRVTEQCVDIVSDAEVTELISDILRESELDMWQHIEEIEAEEEALLADEFESLGLGSSSLDVECVKPRLSHVMCPLCLQGALLPDARCSECHARFAVAASEPDSNAFEAGHGSGVSTYPESRVLAALSDALCVAAETHATHCSRAVQFRKGSVTCRTAIQTEARCSADPAVSEAAPLELACAVCQSVHVVVGVFVL